MRKTRIPDRVRVAVAERYGAKPGVECSAPCYHCGRPGLIYWYARKDGRGAQRVRFGHELDHVIPESAGGLTVPDNLVLACRPCNRSKGTKATAAPWASSGLAMNVRGAPLARQ